MMRDSGDLTLLIHRSMVSAGWNIDALYARLGYDVRELPLYDCRPRHSLQRGFWEGVEETTGDSQVGLSLCPHIPPYRARGLEYVMFASHTLREGLEKLRVYRRLISDAFEIEVVEHEREPRILLKGTAYDAAVRRHAETCFVQAFLQTLATATDNIVLPLRIDFCFSQPEKTSRYQTLFGCPVGFGTDMSEIRLAPGALDTALFLRDPELLKLHCQHANRRLADVVRHDKMDEVFHYLLQQFESGEIVGDETHIFAQAAYDLGLSERRLRFELGEIDTNFRDIFRRARLSYAKRLLENTADRMDDIAARLGFSETSTFSRAFRRYFGLTPTAYRADQAPSARVGRRY